MTGHVDPARDLERARIKKVFWRSAFSFALSGAALALAIWSFLATARTEDACGAYTVKPMFPWGVSKTWQWGANGTC